MKAVVSVAVIHQMSTFARVRMRKSEFFMLTISGIKYPHKVPNRRWTYLFILGAY